MLIDTTNVADTKLSHQVTGAQTESDIINAASIKFFKNYLGNIVRKHHYHFWTGGQWNMHELLAFLLTITGAANVYITTWAISEDAVRALLFLKEKKMIRSLSCIFDYKSKEQKTNAFLLAKQNFEVVLARIHAKVTVIENEQWKMTVTGSANWTRNPRVERQVLCTEEKIVMEDIAIIKRLLIGEHPFKVR